MNIDQEFERFIEFPSDSKKYVTSVSAKLFAAHYAEKLEAAIEELKAEHNTQLQSLIAEREEERETVKKLYKRLTEVVENSGE